MPHHLRYQSTTWATHHIVSRCIQGFGFLKPDPEIVAICKGVLGYSLIPELSNTEETLHIINIQISSHLQGRGLGGRVIRDLLARAASRGCDVELGVFKVNTRALQFYLRLGFHVVGSSETHWEMRWTHNETPP